QRALRIDDLKRSYGRQIVERCGLGEDALLVLDLFDPAKGGKLTAENCHIRPGIPQCQAGGDAKGCYRGQIGEAVLQVLGAGQDIGLARATYEDLRTTADKKNRYCINLHKELDQDGKIMASHEEYMDDLRDAKAAM